MSEEPSDRALLEQMERELLGESPSPDKPSTEGLTEDTRRKRTRGRRSRNRRQRRRHESSDSSRSIYSPSSRSSENSDEDMGMEDDEEEDDNAYLERRAKEAREAPLRAIHEPTSPLEEPRVPKRIEFACSIREAPEIAGLEKKKLRARVKISEKLAEHFDSCAAGLYVGSDERAQHYEKLPLVASGLAVVPVLDEGLRVSSFRIAVEEHTMVSDEEVTMNALNLLAISRNEAAEGRYERADLYVKQAMELLGIGIHDLNVRRRERFFRSFGVDPSKSVPNYRRLPIESPARSADKPWNEFAPALLGGKLASEVVEKTQCQKLTETLLKERRAHHGRRVRASHTTRSRSRKRERKSEDRSQRAKSPPPPSSRKTPHKRSDKTSRILKKK